jgi:hypothetical protein
MGALRAKNPQRSGELLGAYTMSDAQGDPRGVEGALLVRGPAHPETRFMYEQREYRRLVKAHAMGCGLFGVTPGRLMRHLRARLCVRPHKHKGPHRYIVLSTDDTMTIIRTARRRVRFKEPVADLLRRAAAAPTRAPSR